MTSPRSPLPLDELRRRLRDDSDPQTWIKALRGDRRAGARSLLRSLKRRLAEQAAEERRLASLFALRAALRLAGAERIAGVDEVGVGPLAGPVVAAAVVLPDEAKLPGLDDSKRLDRRTREDLAARIEEQAVAFCVVAVEVPEIDEINIYQASLRAMQRCVLGLAFAPCHVLVDARRIPGIEMQQTSIVHGDAVDASIAAASIVAKVYRDALMRRLDEEHPGYGFAQHKGYSTPEHLEALRRLGPCSIHRRSFAPVAASEVR